MTNIDYAAGDELLSRISAGRLPILIWGHPYGTTTHSWIHHGFHRAFEYLGANVFWLKDSRRSARMASSLDRAIVIAEGQQTRRLIGAVRPDWIVWGHNCDEGPLRDRCTYVPVYVRMLDPEGYRNPRWHPEVLHQSDPPSPPSDVIIDGLRIFWATDLLPHEITFTPHRTDVRDVVFVGSVWGNNRDEISQWRSLMDQRGLRWRTYRGIDERRHAEIVRAARFAPAIQGAWQVDHGYIPCRLFKNVSYSQLPVTNNPNAAQVLPQECLVCERELPELADAMLEAEARGRVDQAVRQAQDVVRREHTYVNRISELVAFTAQARPEATARLLSAQ